MGSACSTPTTPPTLSQAEVAQRDRSLGVDFAKAAEAHFVPLKAIDVQIYLRDLAEKIAQRDDDLSDAPVGVYLYRDRDARLRPFSFPGNRIYVATGWLKQVEFEHELAAGLAFELAHLKLRHLMNALERESKDASPLDRVRRFSSLGENWRQWFDFSFDQHVEAAPLAVKWLYAAGFDVRGVVLYWERMAAADALKWDSSLLAKWWARLKSATAEYPPVRNPIVKSSRFSALKTKFRAL